MSGCVFQFFIDHPLEIGEFIIVLAGVGKGFAMRCHDCVCPVHHTLSGNTLTSEQAEILLQKFRNVSFGQWLFLMFFRVHIRLLPSHVQYQGEYM